MSKTTEIQGKLTKLGIKYDANDSERVLGNKLKKARASDNPTVEIGKQELRGLISTVSMLENKVKVLEKGGDVDLPDVKVKKARVHFYKGVVITNVGEAWEEVTEKGKLAMRLEIYIDEELKEVDYKSFVESLGDFTEEECVINEIKTIDDGRKVLGEVNLVEVEYDKFRSKSVGKVPMVVVTPVYEYIMDIPVKKGDKGQEDREATKVAVDSSALN